MGRSIVTLIMLALLGACGAQDDATEELPAIEDEVAPEPEPEATGRVSILRPDIEQPELPPAPPSTLEATIGFPEGGAELDEDAVSALERLVESEQVAMDGPILLGAHSDTDGSDAVNARVAEARGLAVAGWLIDQGVDPERIDVIVFGEQNPIEPNALPDGSPNEEGRSANRRVEIRISPSEDDDAEEAGST